MAVDVVCGNGLPVIVDALDACHTTEGVGSRLCKVANFVENQLLHRKEGRQCSPRSERPPQTINRLFWSLDACEPAQIIVLVRGQRDVRGADAGRSRLALYQASMIIYESVEAKGPVEVLYVSADGLVQSICIEM